MVDEHKNVLEIVLLINKNFFFFVGMLKAQNGKLKKEKNLSNRLNKRFFTSRENESLIYE
jgi:hypothetical protein